MLHCSFENLLHAHNSRVKPLRMLQVADANAGVSKVHDFSLGLSPVNYLIRSISGCIGGSFGSLNFNPTANEETRRDEIFLGTADKTAGGGSDFFTVVPGSRGFTSRRKKFQAG
jgi:hypothetical protein